MEELRLMNETSLINLASDVRSQILDVVSKNGGHLSSNLGIVELTIALHKVFNTPFDQLIFDVSHQTYAHKIITGRKEEFKTLRKYQGISGFSKPDESEFDLFSSGHSSTAVSLAIGCAIANKEKGLKKEVIAVVGDASATNGLTLEALNYLGAHKEIKVIIIINDNDMSVSKNVGALAKTFNKIRVKRKKAFIYKITPKFMHGLLDKMKSGLKGTIYKKSLFDAFNLKYFSGIDGHNFKELEKYLTFAKQYPESVVLHVKTTKGKGYKFAEEDKLGIWHHVGPFNIETGVIHSDNNIQVGTCLSNVIAKRIDKSNDLKIITAAMTLGCGLEQFQTKYPNSIIDVGIAEENAVVIASALASNNVTPIVFIYSTFLQRCYDQILHDVTRTNKHVIFCIDRAGIVASDGDTHQGIFDISYLMPLPNIKILSPSTLEMAEDCLSFALNEEGPIAIRYPKYLPNGNNGFIPYKWIEEIEIKDINVLTYGSDVQLFKKLLSNYNVGIINAVFIKPMDLEMLDRLKNTKKLIIYEQVNKTASLGEQIKLVLDKYIEVVHIALDNTYLTEGSELELKDVGNIQFDKILKEIE